MAINMKIVQTSGPRTVEVPEDIATDLAAAYEALKDLPVNRMVTTDPFEDAKAARLFVRQGKAWAATQTGPNSRPLVFVRKGDVKGNPVVVSFRIYEARESAEAESAEAESAE